MRDLWRAVVDTRHTTPSVYKFIDGYFLDSYVFFLFSTQKCFPFSIIRLFHNILQHKTMTGVATISCAVAGSSYTESTIVDRKRGPMWSYPYWVLHSLNYWYFRILDGILPSDSACCEDLEFSTWNLLPKQFWLQMMEKIEIPIPFSSDKNQLGERMV